MSEYQLAKKLMTIQSKFNGAGIGTVDFADEHGRPELLPSGFTELDHRVLAIGGIPKGRITEVAGETGAGKSTFCLNIMSHAVAQGLSCVYCDIEDTMDYEYGEKVGIPKDAWLLYKCRGISGAEYLESLYGLIESGVDLMIVDSMAFIGSDELAATALNDANMKTNMSVPVLTKNWVQKLYGGWDAKLPENKGKKFNLPSMSTTLLVIDHLKHAIGPTYGKPDKDSRGGETKKFAYSMRLFLERYGMARDKSLLDEDGNPVYGRTKVTCEKSKLGPGGRSTMMYVDQRTGKFYSDQDAIIKFSLQMDVLSQRGAFYSWHDAFIEDETTRAQLDLQDFDKDQKWQGKGKVLEYINSHPKLLELILGVKPFSAPGLSQQEAEG